MVYEGTKTVSALLVLFVIVVALGTVVFAECYTSCDESTYYCPKGCTCPKDYCACTYYVDYMTCPGTLPPVPTVGPIESDTLIAAGAGLSYIEGLQKQYEKDQKDKLKRQTEEEYANLIKREADLSDYYETILKKDPNNFWANWDYAQLKANQKDYISADRLYANAVGTLDEGVKIRILQDAKLSTINKLKIEQQQRSLPDPETSSLLSDMKDWVGEKAKTLKTSYDDAKLVAITAAKKRLGLYNDEDTYRSCVTGQSERASCIVRDLAFGTQ